jgi:hypothetical protein
VVGSEIALPVVASVKQIYQMPHEANGSKMGHIRRVSGRYSLLGSSVRGRAAWPWRRAGGGSTILLNWGWRIGIGVLLATLLVLDASAQPRGTPTRAQQGPALPPSGHQTEPVDLNEGKSPAELFQSGCAVCHQSASGLAKGRREGELTGFLRQHYTSSVQHAGALAGFLAGRGGPAGPAVAAPPSRQAPVERQPASIERPPASIGRRPAEEDRKPQEASRPAEREPASKRKPPAATARTPVPQTPSAPQAVGAAAGAAVEVQEPAPDAAPEPSASVSTPPPVEEKPAAPEIPL